jgi:methyltransferase
MMMAVLFVVIAGFLLVEARRAARNEHAQRARGGVAPPADAAVYRTMRVAYPAAFGAMLTEGILRGGPAPDVALIGAAIFTAAKALKWWAILELGRFWTFRVIVIPGAPLVRTGPYRYVRHPNYVGVFGELIGTACMTGAVTTGLPATFLFTALMVWRSVVEDRALAALR